MEHAYQPPPLADLDRLLPIVVGAHPRAEIGDRGTAYRLRARLVDWLCERPRVARTCWPIVCSDLWYLNDDGLRARPTISIGGPSVNALAAYLADRVPSAFVIDNRLMVQLDPAFEELVVSLWGMSAELTAAAADAFIEKYLESFMVAACER